MPAANRRIELAQFLRSRRERLSPEEVGVPVVGRRRTPGLRREEVAQLAGVGVTWYTWLEQGRPINASASVLQAVAAALRLEPPECSHLFALAGMPPPRRSGSAPLDPAIPRLLEALLPVPAYLTAPCHEVRARNRSAELLFGDYSVLPEGRRNLLWTMFTEPYLAEIVPDWETEAEHLLALYRSAMAEHHDDPRWQALVDELSEVSPRFRAMWEEHHVAQPGGRTKTFVHPYVGVVRFRATSLWLQPRSGNRLVTYVAVDRDTEDALDRLLRSDLRPFRDWSELTRHGRAALATA